MHTLTPLKILNYTTADKTLTRIETINADRLSFIVNNQSIFEPLLSKTSSTHDTVFTNARNYLNLVNPSNQVHVTYIQNNGVGRYYAKHSMSLQSMTKALRHTIAEGLYTDIDIKNCHPTLLVHLCKKLKIKCSILEKYCDNRDAFLNTINVPSSKGKLLMLSIINGGKKEYEEITGSPHPLLAKFYTKEIQRIHDKVARTYFELYTAHLKKRVDDRKKMYNHKASFMNVILCEMENQILMFMSGYFKQQTHEVLCFDGLMLPRLNNPYNLRGCEQAILDEYGLHLQLVEKPFDQQFDLSAYYHTIPKFIAITDDQRVLCKAIECIMKRHIEEDDINDETMSEMFFKLIGSDLVTINDAGDGYKWDPVAKLWLEKSASQLILEISKKCNLMPLVCQNVKMGYMEGLTKCINNPLIDGEKKTLQAYIKMTSTVNKHIKSARSIRDVYVFLRDLCRNDEFKTSIINRQHHLLPITNGNVIDLTTGTVRERLRSDYFSIQCPVDYIPQTQWTIGDISDYSKFVNPIFMNDSAYIAYQQIKMGSYLCGRNARDIDINHGCGKNGKSAIVNALKIIMGGFMAFIGKDVVVYDKLQHRVKGGGNHTSHLIPIEGKRLIITQELEPDDVIDSEIVKKIASADPIEGVRECFGRRTYTMYPFCKLMVTSNNIPKFDANDRAIKDRLVFNPFKSRFMTDEALHIEKESGLYDMTKYTYYAADTFLIQKFSEPGRAMNILFSWLVQGCMKFYALGNHDLQKPAIVQQYMCEKFQENDVVGMWITCCCDVIDHVVWTTMTADSKKDYQTSGKDLYDNFANWAALNDSHKGIGKIAFYKRLEMNFSKVRDRKKSYLYDRIKTIAPS